MILNSETFGELASAWRPKKRCFAQKIQKNDLFAKNDPNGVYFAQKRSPDVTQGVWPGKFKLRGHSFSKLPWGAILKGGFLTKIG